MQQFRIQRLIATMQVVAGTPLTQDLPRGYDYEALQLRINGSVQVTTAGTAVRAEAPCQAVPRVEIVADGRNTLVSAPFWFGCLAHYDRRSNESGSRSTTPPTAAAIATYAVEANGVFDFQTPDGIRGKDSNFRTSALQLFQLRLTFGQAADMFTGATVANFVAGFNVEISSSEMVEIMDPTTKTQTTPRLLKKISFQEIAIPASNVNQEVRLPAGNLIKSIVIRTAGSVTADEPATNILNKVQLSSGVDVRMFMTAAGLRGKNNSDFGAIQAGYYIADVTRSGDWLGNLSELWDVTNQAEPKLICDVTAAGSSKMQVVTTEYLAVPA